MVYVFKVLIATIGRKTIHTRTDKMAMISLIVSKPPSNLPSSAASLVSTRRPRGRDPRLQKAFDHEMSLIEIVIIMVFE